MFCESFPEKIEIFPFRLHDGFRVAQYQLEGVDEISYRPAPEVRVECLVGITEKWMLRETVQLSFVFPGVGGCYSDHDTEPRLNVLEFVVNDSVTTLLLLDGPLDRSPDACRRASRKPADRRDCCCTIGRCFIRNREDLAVQADYEAIDGERNRTARRRDRGNAPAKDMTHVPASLVRCVRGLVRLPAASLSSRASPGA